MSTTLNRDQGYVARYQSVELNNGYSGKLATSTAADNGFVLAGSAGHDSGCALGGEPPASRLLLPATAFRLAGVLPAADRGYVRERSEEYSGSTTGNSGVDNAGYTWAGAPYTVRWSATDELSREVSTGEMVGIAPWNIPWLELVASQVSARAL